MSVPFFNENPLLQFEQNNIINNYLEIENEQNLSVIGNTELEKIWVIFLNIYFGTNFHKEKKKNSSKLQCQLHVLFEPLFQIQFL